MCYRTAVLIKGVNSHSSSVKIVNVVFIHEGPNEIIEPSSFNEEHFHVKFLCVIQVRDVKFHTIRSAALTFAFFFGQYDLLSYAGILS